MTTSPATPDAAAEASPPGPAPPLGRLELAALLAIAAAALALRVAVARALPNLFWPDEIFQTLEQAHRAVFGYGVVPWEFRAGARSWVLPGLLAVVVRATAWTASGPAGYLAGVTAALAAASLAPVVAAFAWARRQGLLAAATAAAVTAVWFELVFFAPKALAEVVGAHALVAGLVLADGRLARSRRRLVGAGALLGLAVVLRPHLAPAVTVAVAWYRPRGRAEAAALLGSLAGMVLVGGLVDGLTWSYPFESVVRGWWANVVEGRSRRYGVLPWHAYLGMVGRTWGSALLLLGPLAVVGAWRRRGVAAVALTVLATHAAVAHKEYRFVYPALVLVVVLAALGAAGAVAWVAARTSSATARPEEAAQRLPRRARPEEAAQRPSRRGAALPHSRARAGAAAAALLGAWSALSLDRARAFDGRATGVADALHVEASHWTAYASTLQAFDALALDPPPCGVGLLDVGWAFTGGYTHLHRDVPLYELWSAGAYRALARRFDATVARVRPGGPLDARDAVRCWPDGVCLFRRSGGCEPDPGYSLNRQLVQWGQ